MVYLPKDRLHSHTNPGDVPAKALVLYRPAGVEAWIEEAGKPAADPPSPPPLSEVPELIERLVATAPKYGVEVPPPPPPE